MSHTTDMVIYYCSHENISMLYHYKALGVDFNKIRDKNGDTLLHIAILEDNYTTFSTLISFGMDLHLTSTFDGTSPLNFAMILGESLYVKKLINSGVDVNRFDADGWTPLHTALLMEDEYPNFVQLLLKTPNIDVNIPFEDLPPIYITDNLNIAHQIIQHPSFDPTYNLVLLESISEPKIEEMIRLYHTNIDETILNSYHQAKVLGMKLDFNDCFVFKAFPDHGYNCFPFEGYRNEVGVKDFFNTYNHFYNQVISLSKIPSWALESFDQVKTALNFTANTSDPALFLNKIHAGELVIIPSGWMDHSIFFVIHDNKLYRCNRGEMSDGIHGIEEFIITKPEAITHHLIKDMLVAEGAPTLLQLDIIDLLGLQKIGEIENPTQIVGNCVWTSLEVALEASFVDAFMQHEVDASMAHYYGKQAFHIWEEYDVFTELCNTIDNKDILIKNEIYDDLLLQALGQHHSPNNLFDIQKGGLVLTQINEPLFHDVFKAEIGDKVNAFYPGFYNDISYMKDYQPASYYDYMKSWALSLNPYAKEDYAKAKEYYDFLKSCDAFQSKNNLAVIDLEELMDNSAVLALENMFSSPIPFEITHLELWSNTGILKESSIEATFG